MNNRPHPGIIEEFDWQTPRSPRFNDGPAQAKRLRMETSSEDEDAARVLGSLSYLSAREVVKKKDKKNDDKKR